MDYLEGRKEPEGTEGGQERVIEGECEKKNNII